MTTPAQQQTIATLTNRHNAHNVIVHRHDPALDETYVIFEHGEIWTAYWVSADGTLPYVS